MASNLDQNSINAILRRLRQMPVPSRTGQQPPRAYQGSFPVRITAVDGAGMHSWKRVRYDAAAADGFSDWPGTLPTGTANAISESGVPAAVGDVVRLHLVGSDVGGKPIYAFRNAGSSAQQLRVKSVADNHLVCRTWDGATEGAADVLVAKPYTLRRSTYDGTTTASGWLLTYNNAAQRTASKSGEESIIQQIDPAYAVNDLIYAVQPTGGTGVSYLDADVLYQDINTDCRRWAFGC